MRLVLKLPSGGQVTLMNVYTPNPAADRKVFWDELMEVGQVGECIMGGDMNSLSGVQDATIRPYGQKMKR